MASEEKKKSGFLERLKKIKHIEYIILAVFLSVAAILMFSGGGTNKNSSSASTSFSLFEYAKLQEGKLSDALSQIKGAGKVKVTITYECGVEYVPVFDESGKGSIITSGGKPVIMKEVEPKARGVIIIAEGAADVKVKLELFKAASTLLSLDGNKIEIFAMKKG